MVRDVRGVADGCVGRKKLMQPHLGMGGGVFKGVTGPGSQEEWVGRAGARTEVRCAGTHEILPFFPPCLFWNPDHSS